jgi:hypothetical protein
VDHVKVDFLAKKLGAVALNYLCIQETWSISGASKSKKMQIGIFKILCLIRFSLHLSSNAQKYIFVWQLNSDHELAT